MLGASETRLDGELWRNTAFARIIDERPGRDIGHERHAGQNALLPSFHNSYRLVHGEQYALSALQSNRTASTEHDDHSHPPDRSSFKTGFARKAAVSETPKRTFVRTSQALSETRTPLETSFQRAKNKKSPRPGKTLRIAPASSSSPVPQPSRERWSRKPRRGSLASGERSAERFPFRAGLLAHGSSYSPCLPIRRIGQWRWRVSSPLTAAGPRGICTLFPYPNMTIVSGTLGESGIFCQVQ